MVVVVASCRRDELRTPSKARQVPTTDTERLTAWKGRAGLLLDDTYIKNGIGRHRRRPFSLGGAEAIIPHPRLAEVVLQCRLEGDDARIPCSNQGSKAGLAGCGPWRDVKGPSSLRG